MTVIDMTNYKKPEEETFENFIKEHAKKVMFIQDGENYNGHDLEEVIKIITDVFDEGVGFGYTMAADDIESGIQEVFEDLGL